MAEAIRADTGSLDSVNFTLSEPDLACVCVVVAGLEGPPVGDAAVVREVTLRREEQ